MSYLAVSKWTRYQHYKTRRPPWIKFYVELVDDVQNKLNDHPVPTRYLFDRLLLLAAKYDNAIPNDPELIAKLLRMDPEDCREGIEQLVKGRWLQEKKTKRTASKQARRTLGPEVEVEVEVETPQTPLSSLNPECPVCGLEKPNVRMLEEHLANVHGVEPAVVVELRTAS
jgi:hypothetical protein